MTGGSGAKLNPDGARWWDGQGGNGGKTKPKFFAAHSLTGSSVINNLYIENTPVQAVSINGCNGLTINSMTIDNRAGDSAGGHNTDGFDIGSSSNVVINGATVYNQDDCVAINSGTVRQELAREEILGRMIANCFARISLSAVATALVVTVFPLAVLAAARTILLTPLPSRTLLSPSLTTVRTIYH